MTDVVLRPAAEAFTEVGVWVAALLVVFGVVQRITRGRLVTAMTRHRGRAIVAAATLGMLPGCGGALLLTPLYLRGSVTFGALAAGLVATMGDSSFVLLAAAPMTGLLVHGVLLVAGVATGLVVEALGVRPRVPATLRPHPSAGATSTVGAAAVRRGMLGERAPMGLAASTGVFFALVLMALITAVPVTLHLTAPWHVAALEVPLVVGLVGTGLCALAALRNRGRGCAPRDPAALDLHVVARDTAIVVTWVAAILVTVEVVLAAGSMDLSGLAGLGVLGVISGAVVGLIPGCGAQLALTGVYTQGLLPLSTLAANAVSQDGDALLPLLVADRRAAVMASLVTLVPALATGLAVHAVAGG